MNFKISKKEKVSPGLGQVEDSFRKAGKIKNKVA